MKNAANRAAEWAADWAALRQLSHIHASADGAWAFWCQSGLHETDEVYATRTDGSTLPERLTFGVDHFVIRDASPDGSRLILAQSRNASEHDHLFLLDRTNGNLLRQLTPEQGSHYLYGGVFTADLCGVIFAANHDYEQKVITEGGWVWHLDLASGKFTCLARSDTPFEAGPRFSPNGQNLLWHRHEHAPGGTQLWVMTAGGGDLREVLNLGPSNNSRGVWLDDARIAVVTDHESVDKIGILDLATQKIEWIAGEPVLCPHEVLAGGGGLFACIVHDSSQTKAVLFPGALALVNLSGRRSLLPHASLAGGGWLAEAYDADGPHQLVRVGADGACTNLTTAEPSARAAIRPVSHRWNAPDGRQIQGWLYHPKAASKGLIVYVHGGPTWHSEDWMNPKIGFWVQLGYTVLDPNYRGSTGFGFALREAVKQDGWGGREQGDIRAGIESLIAQGIAVKGKIAVAGNSYGGFSSWFAITRHADLVNAAIPMCGMYRLDIDYHATEMPHGRAYSEQMMGGTPEAFPEKYANASPGFFIDRIKGDILIVHGLADSNVGPENTHTAMRELATAGIAFDSLLFANEGHGVFRRSNVEIYLARSAIFLEQAFTKGR